jgi:hypothetical protein
VDPLRLPLSFYVTPANVHDTYGAHCLLAVPAYLVPRPKRIWADQAYQGHDLAEWYKAKDGVMPKDRPLQDVCIVWEVCRACVWTPLVSSDKLGTMVQCST